MIFLRYVSIQLLAYVIDMGIFLFILHVDLVGPIVANIVAKLAAGICAFFAHRHFTFESATPDSVKTQAIRYFVLLAANVPVSSGILAVIMLWLPMPVIAKLLADIFCVGLSYSLSKYLIFNTRIVSSAER